MEDNSLTLSALRIVTRSTLVKLFNEEPLIATTLSEIYSDTLKVSRLWQRLQS